MAVRVNCLPIYANPGTLPEGESELALRLASALWFFWDMRGHLREGKQWLEAALSTGSPAEGGTLRPAALNAAGWLALVQHASYGPSIALLEQAQATAEAGGDNAATVREQAFLGLALALGSSEPERCQDLLERAVQGGRAIGDTWAVALSLYGKGPLALLQGRLERTQERWQTCAAVAQDVGNLYGLSYLQFRWGLLALQSADLERAAACLRESLRLSAELDSTREMAVAIAALALVAAAAGEAERGVRLAGGTQSLLERAGCDLPGFCAPRMSRPWRRCVNALVLVFSSAGSRQAIRSPQPILWRRHWDRPSREMLWRDEQTRPLLTPRPARGNGRSRGWSPVDSRTEKSPSNSCSPNAR
jgi:hypothetical protein